MEQTQQKRPRTLKNGKRFKCIYPEYFGLMPDTRLIFEQTRKGYKAPLNGKLYIGMPSSLIEKNKHLFLPL